MPVGTRDYRVTKAIHWHFTTDMSLTEIGEELGVEKSTVQNYLNEPAKYEADEALKHQRKQVRIMAIEELKRQLKEVGSKSRSAEKPVKVWTDDDGNVSVRDVEDGGTIVDRQAIPQDVELMPDEKARYFARSEAREIIEQMAEFVGAKEPEQHEVTHSGGIDIAPAFVDTDV